jgi:hypothetical protein
VSDSKDRRAGGRASVGRKRRELRWKGKRTAEESHPVRAESDVDALNGTNAVRLVNLIEHQVLRVDSEGDAAALDTKVVRGLDGTGLDRAGNLVDRDGVGVAEDGSVVGLGNYTAEVSVESFGSLLRDERLFEEKESVMSWSGKMEGGETHDLRARVNHSGRGEGEVLRGLSRVGNEVGDVDGPLRERKGS